MWVLIVMLVTGPQQSNSVAMHDFMDEASCYKAQQMLLNTGPKNISLYAFCTPKSATSSGQSISP